MFCHNYLKILIIGAAFWALESFSALAWSNHACLTQAALDGQAGYREEVSAEPLEDFLEEQENKIGELLQAEEKWALANVDSYPARPQALDFQTSPEADLRGRFLKALRINPEIKTPLYIRQVGGGLPANVIPLPKSAVSVLGENFEGNLYLPLRPGEKISALDVLASGSDEPDNGMDIGLWEDNETAFGKEYAYGKQPFGNPKLNYGTQAPFHMGIYHESKIIYAAAPDLKRTFPEQRVHLFRSLSELAFETGHPYWGYRFAGWGLHYLQDMTMPYHASIMPGRSTINMLTIPLLDMIGVHGPLEDAVGEVSRAHILMEKLLVQDLRKVCQNEDENSEITKALRDTSKDRTYPPYSDHFTSQIAAKESHAVAGDIAAALKAVVIDKKLYRDIEKISMEGDYDAKQFIAGAPEESVRNYNRLIEDRMRSVGAFSRIYMGTLKK